VSPEHLENVILAVSRINGVAPKILTTFGKVDLDSILDLHAYDGRDVLPDKFPADSSPHLVNF
jgi:G3E family GTPase